MPAYNLLIATPKPAFLIVTAPGDEAAESLSRESLQYNFAGEVDPAVLASRVNLVMRVGGKPVFETTLAEVLGVEGGIAHPCP